MMEKKNKKNAEVMFPGMKDFMENLMGSLHITERALCETLHVGGNYHAFVKAVTT